MALLWGIDLGGTKIEIAIIDESTREPVFRHRIPTEASFGYDRILENIERLIGYAEHASGFARSNRIGIGTPGVSDPKTGLMRNANTVCLIGMPLLSDLETLCKVQIVGANDANCFAQAESQLGAGRGYSTVFGIILGTGVGGGIVVDGRALGGANGIAGEWGHNQIPGESEPCYCGKVGCVETVISGPALEKWFFTSSGQRKSLKEVDELSKDPSSPLYEVANQTLEHLYESFGRAVSVVSNIFDPEVIVIGGGVGNLSGLYEHGAAALKRHAFCPDYNVKLVKPLLGDSAGVFGAALLSQV